MKRLFPIFLLLISILSCSQEKFENQTIKTDFKKYLISIQNKKIDEALNCIYPRFFEIVPKDHMKQMLELNYNNPQLNFAIKKFEIENVKIPEKIKSEYFTTVNYRFDVDLKLNSEELKSKQNLLEQGLESKFGSNNVKFDTNNQTFHISSNKKAIGISENGKTNWKFVVMENEYKPYLLKILPEKIINEN